MHKHNGVCWLIFFFHLLSAHFSKNFRLPLKLNARRKVQNLLRRRGVGSWLHITQKHSRLRKRTNLWTAVAITIINTSLQKLSTGMDSVTLDDNPHGFHNNSVWVHEVSGVMTPAILELKHRADVTSCSVRAVHGALELLLSNRTSVLGRDTHGGRLGRK